MGGVGSGRPSGGGRDTVEGCRSLDVNRLHREGCLRPGWSGSWRWTRAGDRVASINLHAEADRLLLSYRCRLRGGEWENVEEPVPLVRVPCRFGGNRPYFRCPGVVNSVPCGKRVAKLYGPGRYFVCRHCNRLTYISRNEGTWDRAIRRVDKLRTRLGGDPGPTSPFPTRPKGMWQRTYDRLRVRMLEAQRDADRAFVVQAARLLSSTTTDRRKEFWQ